MAKFAHFENVAPQTVFDLYQRHAEVARDIHALAIREMTGRDDVQVDLVRRDPNVPDAATFDEMSKYDVISVSSLLTSFGEAMNEGLVDAMKDAIDRFKGHMPAVIMSVGNDGEKDNKVGVKITELTRNGFTIGEANSFNGQHMIETHSANKPNMAAVNPLDTRKFQYIEMTPDLAGHENLVKNFVLVEELISRVQVGGAVGQEQMLMQNPDFAKDIEQKVSAIIKDPSAFHKKIQGLLKEQFDFDEKGYLTGVDGTSFSAPYQAGSVSGAILLEEERATKNLPSLTVDEIMTIAKLSTEQVSLRESVNAGEPYGMHSYENAAGQIFTSHGGHGVFSSDKFKTLLDEAHKIIETTPDIDRTAIVHDIAGKVSDKLNISFQIPEHVGGNLVFEKMLITYETPGIEKANGVTLDRDGAGAMLLNNRGKDDYNWFATDRYFGETVNSGSTWNLKAFTYQGQGHIENPQLQLYAYREDSLLGQMIAKHGDDPKLQVKPEVKESFNLMSSDPNSRYTYNEQVYIEMGRRGHAADFAAP